MPTMEKALSSPWLSSGSSSDGESGAAWATAALGAGRGGAGDFFVRELEERFFFMMVSVAAKVQRPPGSLSRPSSNFTIPSPDSRASWWKDCSARQRTALGTGCRELSAFRGLDNENIGRTTARRSRSQSSLVFVSRGWQITVPDAAL